MAKRAHANLYEDPFPSYLTASWLPPLESPPPPADLLSLSKYQVAFFFFRKYKYFMVFNRYFGANWTWTIGHSCIENPLLVDKQQG